MKKVYLIIKREFLVQIKQKSFIIITFFTPIFILLLFCLLSIIYTNKDSLNVYKIGVIDNNSEFKLKSDQNILFSFLTTKHNNEDSFLKEMKKFDGLLVIPKYYNLSSLDHGIYLYLKNNHMDHLINHLSSLLYKQVELIKLKKIGINRKIFNLIDKTDFQLNTLYLENNLLKMNSQLATKYLLISIMMYIIMMFILIYGVRIMRSVFEEKNNRIVEIILSSVQPIQLMIGKILGTALVAFTQFIIWIFFIFTIFFIFKNLLHNYTTLYIQNFIETFSLVTNYILNTDYLILIFMFIIYFFGGYLLFSAIFAAIGSCIEVNSEPQQFSILASIILLIAFYVGLASFYNPNNILGLILSLFPLTSPIVMLSRVTFNIPMWQIILSIFLLFFSVINVMYLASKIYSMNILIHHKRSFFSKIKL